MNIYGCLYLRSVSLSTQVCRNNVHTLYKTDFEMEWLFKNHNLDLARVFKIGRFWWSEVFRGNKIQNHNPTDAPYFNNVKTGNMIARYNTSWQAKVRNYEQLKKLKCSLWKHKYMISKLIQLVVCLPKVVLVLWPADLPFT